MRRLVGICVGLAASVMATTTASFADDDAYVAVDPTSVLGRGNWTIQQWLGWTNGHSRQSFNGVQSVTEIDYGATDRLQLALNIENDWQRTREGQQPAAIEDELAVSAEAIYVLMPSEHGNFGLSLAFDPAISKDSRGYALRVLMQKDVFGFENVLNVGFEHTWERGDGGWNEGSGIAINYGIAFPVDEHWAVSLEANNELGFDGLFPSAIVRESSDTYFAGPTIQYDCQLAVFTLGAQAQIPWSGGSDASHGFTADAERFRAIFRVSKSI